MHWHKIAYQSRLSWQAFGLSEVSNFKQITLKCPPKYKCSRSICVYGESKFLSVAHTHTSYLFLHPLRWSSLGHDHLWACVKHHSRSVWNEQETKQTKWMNKEPNQCLIVISHHFWMELHFKSFQDMSAHFPHWLVCVKQKESSRILFALNCTNRESPKFNTWFRDRKIGWSDSKHTRPAVRSLCYWLGHHTSTCVSALRVLVHPSTHSPFWFFLAMLTAAVAQEWVVNVFKTMTSMCSFDSSSRCWPEGAFPPLFSELVLWWRLTSWPEACKQESQSEPPTAQPRTQFLFLVLHTNLGKGAAGG